MRLIGKNSVNGAFQLPSPLRGFTSYSPDTRFMVTAKYVIEELLFVKEPAENCFVWWVEDDMGYRHTVRQGLYHDTPSPPIRVRLRVPTYSVAINGQRLAIP